MNFAAPLGRLQKSSGRLYLQFAERFSENNLIRDAWTEMARDLEHQTASMREIRSSFWKELKKDEKALISATKEISTTLEKTRRASPTDGFLHYSFVNSIEFEELLTLKIYAPLLYKLKSQWTNRALSFYVTVNAHITRLVRLVQQFSGDPILIQRSASLQERFEREAQGPKPEPISDVKRRAKGSIRVKQESRRVPSPRKSKLPVKISARRSSSLAKRSKRLVKQAKPMIKGIPRRRARSRS